MGKTNQMKNATPERRNYKLYKAKKQWITACATFFVMLGVTTATQLEVHADTSDTTGNVVMTQGSASTNSQSAAADSSAATSASSSAQSSLLQLL